MARPAKLGSVQDDRRCFACGPDNAVGLQMTFEYGDGTARSVVKPKRHLSGWSALLHGGIVATLLDEAMAHAAISLGIRAVTAKLEVRFRTATPVDDRALVVEGRIEQRRGRMLEMTSDLRDEAGTLYAHARGRFVAEV